MDQQAIDAIFCRRQLRIIEVVDVNRDSIAEGCETGRQFYGGPQHRRTARPATQRCDVLLNQRRSFGSRSTEGESQAVENRLLSEFDGLVRNPRQLSIDDEVRHSGLEFLNLQEGRFLARLVSLQAAERGSGRA